MSPKWIVFIVFVFVLMQLAGFVMEGGSLTPEMQNHLNVISSWGIVSEEQPFGVLDYIRAPFNYFASLWVVLTYDSPVFDGQYELLRWVFVAPILAGISFGLVVLFFSAFRRNL